jgi:hypothetical protein
VASGFSEHLWVCPQLSLRTLRFGACWPGTLNVGIETLRRGVQVLVGVMGHHVFSSGAFRGSGPSSRSVIHRLNIRSGC